MKKLNLLLIMLAVSFAVSAKVNLSGTWKLNKDKSKLNEQFSMAPEKLIVTHDGNDLKLERHVSFQGDPFVISDTFTLDGKECINNGWMDSKKKSKAVWDSDMKKLSITTLFPMQDGDEMEIKEVIYIDGVCLILENKSSSPFGDSEEKQVFDKQ